MGTLKLLYGYPVFVRNIMYFLGKHKVLPLHIFTKHFFTQNITFHICRGAPCGYPVLVYSVFFLGQAQGIAPTILKLSSPAIKKTEPPSGRLCFKIFFYLNM